MPDEEIRRTREINAAIKQIKSFQRKAAGTKWRLAVPVWRLALEGVAVFVLAFMSGLGLAVLFQVFSG